MSLADTAVDWNIIQRSSDAVTYRGPDRRRASMSPSDARSSTIALGAFLVVGHAVVLLAAWQGSWSTDGRTGPTEWLTASVAVIVALAGAIHAMRWRLVGDASALWIAAGLLVYAAANIAFPGLVRSFGDGNGGPESLAHLMRPVSVFVVMTLLTLAVAAPTIDARIKVRRVAGVAGVAALMGLVAAWASSDFRLLLGPAVDRVPVDGPGAFGQVGMTVLWLGLAIAFFWRAWPEWRGAAPWLGIMLIGLAEARLTLALSVSGEQSWMLASQLCRLIGVVGALGGAIHELQLAFARQGSKLLDSIVELGSTQAQRRAELASAEERAHDLRAALAGIGTAAVTLERYHDDLSADERVALANAVAAEIVRLQQIVSEVSTEPVAFTLADALQPVVACARSQGAAVAVDITPGLTVEGRPAEVAEVVQNLLDNGRRHAAGSSIDVRAMQSEHHVEVRVEDRGPGVPKGAHRRVFDRGWRGDTGVEGSGLGLYVAARLVREQGGDLRVEDRPGGGASFVLTLAAAGEGDAR